MLRVLWFSDTFCIRNCHQSHNNTHSLSLWWAECQKEDNRLDGSYHFKPSPTGSQTIEKFYLNLYSYFLWTTQLSFPAWSLPSPLIYIKYMYFKLDIHILIQFKYATYRERKQCFPRLGLQKDPLLTEYRNSSQNKNSFNKQHYQQKFIVTQSQSDACPSLWTFTQYYAI